MALLDRVATLVRANLNDLVDRAENPEKMLKQVSVDLENQYIQVKTQLALTLADLHLLEKKQRENSSKHAEWMSKAELAVGERDDQLARAALRYALSFEQLAGDFREQAVNQEHQVESLKSALKRLEAKLSETRATIELLIVRQRRARAMNRAAAAENLPDDSSRLLDRMSSKVSHEESLGEALTELAGSDVYRRLHTLERGQKIDALLNELKTKRGNG
jgi:phage shock protein A